MEIISLPSYTREEKFNIAKKHLAMKQIKRHGMNGRQLRFTDKAIYELIDGYTREAGVRNLERQIASVCRKAAKLIANGEVKSITVNEKKLREFLGPRKFRTDKKNTPAGSELSRDSHGRPSVARRCLLKPWC